MTTTTEITIECVWCNSRKEFNKFCRNNPGETVIDFYSIRNKLVKSDPYDTEPHRSVIGLAIRDSFINVLNKNADLEKIIYFRWQYNKIRILVVLSHELDCYVHVCSCEYCCYKRYGNSIYLYDGANIPFFINYCSSASRHRQRLEEDVH